jgi:hypothetical protein
MESLAPLAQAAGPVQSTSPWDRTRVIAAGTDACPFAIQVHSAGTIHTWTYADGTVKTILQNFHIEWTNLDTGKVATTPLGGPAIVYPDGTVVINGNDARFVAAGQGLVVADLGRAITTVEVSSSRPANTRSRSSQTSAPRWSDQRDLGAGPEPAPDCPGDRCRRPTTRGCYERLRVSPRRLAAR